MQPILVKVFDKTPTLVYPPRYTLNPIQQQTPHIVSTKPQQFFFLDKIPTLSFVGRIRGNTHAAHIVCYLQKNATNHQHLPIL